MLDLEKLRAVKTIVVHANCPDGIASSILLHDALPDAEVKHIQYSTEEHKTLPVTPGMLFVDIGPTADRADKFVEAGAIILDHHKDARPVVEAFGDNGVFGDEKTEPGVCGAVLAYRHVWFRIKYNQSGGVDGREVSAAEDFATLAGIRDTWQNKHPRWQEATVQAEMLFFFPVEHWLSLARPFDPSIRDVWDWQRQVALIQVEKHAKSVKNALSKAWRFTSVKGTRVVAFAGPQYSSDAAEALGTDADLVIGFGFLVENGVQKMILSLRSHTGRDVSAIAKKFDRFGGGHTAAAGFNVVLDATTPSPYRFIEMLLWEFEGA